MNKIRNANDASDKITSLLSSLFDDGFHVSYKMYDNQSFGNWIVVLRSRKCTLRFVQDRGDIHLMIAPPWVSDTSSEGKHFIELGILIDYLNNKPLSVLSPHQPKDIDVQLDDIKSLLLDNYDRIITFLNAEDFLKKEKEIKALWFSNLKQMYPNIKFQEDK